MYPHSLTPAQTASVLARAGFRRKRRPIDRQAYRNALDGPVAVGIVHESETSGELTAAWDWSTWLAVEAFKQKRLVGIEGAFRRSRSRYWFDGASATMTLRCHAVAGRFAELDRELEYLSPEDWRWLVRPGGAAVLAGLPARYSDDAFEGCFTEVLRTAEPWAPILDAYARSRADRAAHAASVACIHAFRGAFDEALEVFAELPDEARGHKDARTGLASTRALLAMLRGDDAEAIRFIDEAVACEKAGTRRRNVFPLCLPFTLSLLSLIRDDTPANAAKLKHLLSVSEKVDSNDDFLLLVILAELSRNGDGAVVNRHVGDVSISRFFWGLAACWSRSFPGREDGGQFATLLHFGAKAQGNGYRWLSTECLDVCARWWRFQDRPESELATLVGLGGPGVPSTLAEFVASAREELDTTPLASLVVPVPEWERKLRGIEQVAHEAGAKRRNRKKPASPGQRRLAWFLEEDRYGDVAASAKEQRQSRNGSWSKGRAVALRRLKAEAGTLDFLADQDRRVAKGIVERVDGWRGRSEWRLGPSGLFELAGHPWVFNRAGDRIEVARRDPELLLEEENGMLRLRIDPHASSAVAGGYRVRWTGDGRLEVTRFTAEHDSLCREIPAQGVSLPIEARERLVGAISTLAGEIRVQGDMEGMGQAVPRVEADPRPWVRLAPSGPGLAATLQVEPVPGAGIYCQPGSGGASALATVDGAAVQALRDLEAETAAARELIGACPALSALGPDASLTVEDPAQCLELVDQLDVAGARCLWPKGQPFKVAARADASSLRLSVRSAADWFSVSGALELDADRAIELRALFERIDRDPSSRFVPLGNGEFVSLSASFRRQLADLRGVSEFRGKKGVRLHGLAAHAMRDLFDGTRLDADGAWRRQRERFEEARTFEPRLPGTLQAELRPYQEEGFRWLARLGRVGAGACLADDMGLGKTVQTLALLLDRAAAGPALVVAPTSVVANWLDEARRFAPTLNAWAYAGPAASRAARLEGVGPFDVVVATYGLLHNDVDALSEVAWSTCVLDEAQAIKNPATKRAVAARKLKAGFRVVTTGTPIQNSLIDLYSLFSFLNPGMLGSRKRFQENFALPIGRDGDPAARARLRRMISPFVLRRVKAEVLDDLPPRTEVTLHVEMSAEEAALYEALRQRAVEDLEALAEELPAAVAGAEAGQRRLQVLAHLTRLRLACCNPRLVHPEGPASSKMRTFAATLDELRQGRHRVLVFSQFVRHLKLIEEHLTDSGIPYQYLDGSTPAKARAERIAAFQAGEGDAFLISLKAGGTGLNLTAADYVIHMDPWWNPAAEDQASDRAHRIGQTRPVTIYRLVTRGTIEERIVDLHRHKRELADRLLEGADASSRLSTEELLDLLRLAE